MNIFSRFFEDDDTVDAEGLAESNQILEFGRMPYFEKFMAYLEREGDRPLEVGDQISMIRSAARINTFKEIRAHLRKQLKDAAALIERSQDV